ncbi:hypothetical protein AB0K48_31485, partial [Nonomuraea sp. NPDC055795]
YRLSGARLEVQLIPAVLDIHGTIVRGPEKGWSSRTQPAALFKELNEWNIELAEVRITNVGRTAISVSEISLDYGRFRRWRLGRYLIRGTPVAAHGCSMDDIIRLDPGSSTSVLFDFWLLSDKTRRAMAWRKVLHVRATAKPAGRSVVRSRWRKRWSISRNHDRFLSFKSSTAEMAAFRTLWRRLYVDESSRNMISATWFTILPMLKKGASDHEMGQEMDKILGPGNRLLAFDINTEFEVYSASSEGNSSVLAVKAEPVAAERLPTSKEAKDSQPEDVSMNPDAGIKEGER